MSLLLLEAILVVCVPAQKPLPVVSFVVAAAEVTFVADFHVLKAPKDVVVFLAAAHAAQDTLDADLNTRKNSPRFVFCLD